MIILGMKFCVHASRDLVRYNFPISAGFGEGAVIPFWQVGVEEDFHGLFEVLGTSTAGCVTLFQNVHRDTQARASLRSFDELPRNFHRVKNHPLAGPREMRKHAMLDRIVLRAVRRIVRHANFQPQTRGQPLQILLEQVLLRAVASAPHLPTSVSGAIPPHLRHVLNSGAYRAVEVVIERLDRLLRKSRAGSVEITQQFLLFRVDTDDRIARVEVFPPQPRDVLELCVAVGMMPHRFLLPRGAPSQSELTQQATNRPATGGRAQSTQSSRQFPQRQVGPQDAGPHRVARREFAQHLSQIGFELRTGLCQPFASTPFFLVRSAT